MIDNQIKEEDLEEFMGANVIKVDEESWDREVIESNKPVMVDFWAEWCPPCLTVAPVFEELADEYCTKIKFAKLDIDDNQRLAGRYQIKGIPTFIVFVNGEEKLRLMGHKPKELFVAELSEWLEAKSLAK